MTMYRRVSTRVAPLGNQTISQLNPMAAHRIADDSDPTRSPELTEREAAAAIDVVKKYATSFGVPAKELSGKMIVAFALNVSRIEMGTRLNAAITNHGAIANVLQDVISYLRTKGITSDSAVHQFQEFAHAIGAVNSEVASADSKITTKISRGLGYDAAGNRTISESAHAKFASGRGPESDYVESERWERILVRIPLLARHLLEEMGRHLQIDPSKTHLSEQESMVFAAVPTIINAYRAEYADLAEAHQTGSRYIPPIRGRADADPATYLFFAGHGTVERTFGGQFYPRMGYATMKGTGEGRYLILPSATSKSTSLIVAKVQGSTEMPARKALLAIAENIQNRNGDVEAPGGAGHLEIVCEGVDDDLPASERLSGGASLMAITDWAGPNILTSNGTQASNAAIAQEAIAGQRLFNIATYGKFPIRQFTVHERAYDGFKATPEIEPDVKPVGHKGGRAVGMAKTGCVGLFTFRTEAVQGGTSSGHIRWRFILSPEIGAALPKQEITEVADTYRFFPEEKIAQEILNLAKAKGVTGHQFAIVYRGNGLPPNQDWKKTGSGDTFLRKPPLPAPTAADAFLPSGARIPRLYRPGEPMQGIPRFAIPISPDHIAFPFGTMYGLRMRPNTVRLEDGIISRMRLGDPRQIATGPIQIQPGGILTGQWGQSKVIVQSAGACLSLKQDSIHTIISPDETNSNAFSIGLAPSPMFGTYRGGVSQIRAARIAGAIASMPNPETETRVSVIELGQKTGKAAIFGLGDFGAVINESPAKQIGGHAAGHPSSKVFIGTDATGNYGFPTAAAMWESDVSISKQQILVIATHDVLRAFNGGSDFSRLLPKGTVLNTTTNMAQTIVEEARRKTTGGRLAATLIQIGSSR